MSTSEQTPDGRWVPATPIGPIPGWDGEVTVKDGRHHWSLYLDGTQLIAEGSTQTSAGATLAMGWARWRNRKAADRG